MTIEQEFALTMTRAMRLIYLLGAELSPAASSEQVQETSKLLWAFRRAGVEFRKENPTDDAEEGLRREFARLMGEAIAHDKD